MSQQKETDFFDDAASDKPAAVSLNPRQQKKAAVEPAAPFAQQPIKQSPAQKNQKPQNDADFFADDQAKQKQNVE